jgi:5-formyltetrahydrofolate cyclo-ligase
MASAVNTEEIKKDKSRCRREMRIRRDALQHEYLDYCGQKAADCLNRFPGWESARCVAAFASMPREIDTFPLLRRILETDRTLLLPRVDYDSHELHLYEVRDLERDLRLQGRYNILEPISSCQRIAPESIDIALLPGLAFDPRGNRIGYGGGYYDRLLSGMPTLPVRVGMCCDFQILGCVPHTETDIPVDAICSEKGLCLIHERQYTAASPEDMRECAKQLEAELPGSVVVGLCGVLGAGKTEWTRGFFAACTDRPEEIVSPSYNLINVYPGRKGPLYHADLYRLGGKQGGVFSFPELEEIFDRPGKHVVEWADRALDWMPNNTVWIEIDILPDGVRQLRARWLALEE